MKKKSILLISFIFIIIHLLADNHFQSISGTFGERRSSLDNEWINMNPASAPNGRYYFDMAADFTEHKVVLFGGLGQVGGDYCSLDDTWIYNPSSNIWENPAPAVHPPRRYGHTMSYSSVDSVIVVFGGVDPYDDPVVFNDIWFYHINSNTWEEANIISPIPARGFQSMTFDS
ncbi:MAG: hypothetical protein KAW88_00820, partial [Candidatus Cloacimonetes bacterium]|nr:hypothetical protein [Candidatus Cloacimonadota bacterium]